MKGEGFLGVFLKPKAPASMGGGGGRPWGEGQEGGESTILQIVALRRRGSLGAKNLLVEGGEERGQRQNQSFGKEESGHV